MIQLCERPKRFLEARRLSAEEFCALARGEAGSLYRPRSDVMRMLTVGEAVGVSGADRSPDTALILLPVDADVAAAAALRDLCGCEPHCRGFLLTPPVGGPSSRTGQLVAAARAAALRYAPGCPVWAVLECVPEAEALVPVYLEQGFALRAMRPLNSLSPCYLFTSGGPLQPKGESVWLPLADPAHLAQLLCRGWAAVSSRDTPRGPSLELIPV